MPKVIPVIPTLGDFSAIVLNASLPAVIQGRVKAQSMEKENAEYWKTHLGLMPHPEGGYYKEIYRSEQETVRVLSLEIKSVITSIYYLLEGSDFSGFHRLSSDEIWYFHQGSSLQFYIISAEGKCRIERLGGDGSSAFAVVVPGGSWFAAEIPYGRGYALVSCAVAPGFEFEDFELGRGESLTGLFPEHSVLFDRLCRQ
jgi:predicted cupin superfamily sugar epimerase